MNKKLAELNKEQAKLNKKAKYYQSPQISEKSSSIKNRNFKREKIDNRSFENANLENQKFEDEKSFSVSSRKNSITDSDEENKEKFENSLFEEEEEEYFANSFNEENIKGTPSNLYDDDGNNEEEEEFDQNESDEQSSIKSFSDNEKMSQEEIEKEEEEVWQMIDKMIDTIRARSKYFRELYDKAEADIENAKQLQSSSGSSHSSKQIEKLAHMKAFKKRRVKQSIIEHSPTISYNENSLDKYLHRNIQNFEIFDLNPIRANKHPDSCIIKKSQTPQILSKSHFSPKLQDMKPMQSPSSFNFDEFNQIEETSQPRSKTYNAKNLQTNPTKNKSSTQKYPTFNKEKYDQQYENENFASSTSSKSRKSVSSSTMRRKNPNQRKILIFADGEAQTEPVSSSEIY
ncbi:hypothetical protein TRFO_35219 [Tritrichomonas foetus]|uniref:Uncharacterized protein n=1 Tax=Tritrichomonas foetus TaxID=1144522 RepID=A0A1J4JGW9_9EUKA|nr:hypothetical protein TRFO_35219 [Tritrichomonas foetus]|eukprot:OHS98402.1 hypothetical protein TRFO_35219 [Tritrichomonas foetus]